jgi:hypothetical protein
MEENGTKINTKGTDNEKGMRPHKRKEPDEDWKS